MCVVCAPCVRVVRACECRGVCVCTHTELLHMRAAGGGTSQRASSRSAVRDASCTASASAAFCTLFGGNLVTMSTACCDEMNSQTPSEHANRIL